MSQHFLNTTKALSIQVLKVYPVLERSVESKLVFRFPIWDFISFEPINGGLQVSRLKSSYIVNICNTSTTDEKSRIACATDVIFPNSTSGFYCKLFVLLKLAASGSSVLITMTFQSVSPSSIKARVPSTFTVIISPREHT